MIDLKLLVVDDNESDLVLFSEAIETIIEYLRSKDIILEINISEVFDGIECVNKCMNNNFDLIFLDIKMPRMDGIECLEKLKQNKVKSHIIMFTTSDYDEDISKSNSLGANGYLIKSLDVMEFEENLKSLIVLFIQDNFVYVNLVNDRYKNVLK